MNTILPLNRLAEMLAARAGMEKDAAENFIIRFFETIENGLAADGVVTVKGFGTFRVEGEDVVFEPADEFAAAVNAPFEMFAPVEIARDVDASALFDAIDKTEESLTDEKPADEKPIEEESVDEIPIEEQIVEEPEKELPIESTEEPVEESVICNPVVEPDNDEDVDEEVPTSVSDAPPVVVYRRGVSRCCVVLWLIVGLVAGMIIGLFGGYLGRDKIDAMLGFMEAHPDSVPEPVVEQPVDTMPVELTDSDIADINDPTTDPENVKESEPVKPTVPVEVYDTITSRRFLTTMARKYYGHQDYWVYIYKANAGKLRHPDRIRPGTRVLIPDFEKYRTSPDPEQNRTDARREGVRIYERYK